MDINGYEERTYVHHVNEGEKSSYDGELKGRPQDEEWQRAEEEAEGEIIRKELMALLDSRHQRKAVPFIIRPGTDVKGENSQILPSENPNLAHIPSLANVDISSTDPEFIEENIIIQIEEGKQGNVPLLIIKKSNLNHDKKESGCYPAIVIVHSSYKSKEHVHTLLKTYAKHGYIAIGIDSRYHGQRATSKTTYLEALVDAWRDSNEMPFIFDTAWDLVQLMDYLTTRCDIDSKRIGIMGISLGGMHAWFAATLEPRYAVVVPIIGVQNFLWAIKNNKWHARVASIPYPFEVATKDLRKSEIDPDVICAVLQKIAPNLIERFDSQYTIPAIAPRPLLIINGKEDPRCPVEGLEYTINKTKMVYEKYGYPHHFKFVAELGVGHHTSSFMLSEAICWFDRFLKPQMSS